MTPPLDVAILGAGALQFIPEIARTAERRTRRPDWRDYRFVRASALACRRGVPWPP